MTTLVPEASGWTGESGDLPNDAGIAIVGCARACSTALFDPCCPRYHALYLYAIAVSAPDGLPSTERPPDVDGRNYQTWKSSSGDSR